MSVSFILTVGVRSGNCGNLNNNDNHEVIMIDHVCRAGRRAGRLYILGSRH